MATSGKPMQPSQGLTEVLGRALTDEKFRQRLKTDRAAAVKEFRLTKADLEALDSIPQDQIEEHAARFSSGAATAITVGISVKGTF